LEAQGFSDHNRVWDQTGFSTIDTLTAAMQTDTAGHVDYFFDFHSDNGSAVNYFNTVPELVTSDFSLAMTSRDPTIQPVASDGHPGMSRIWAMSEAGLSATYAYTPEQHDSFSEAEYLDLGRTYALALYDVIISEPPTLRPGDADQDLDFDQFDLVLVQQSAKYLTGQAATWGEGDWNGAPGGAPGEPPAGDGLFNQFDIIAAQQVATYLTGPYAAVQAGERLGVDNDANGNIFKATFGSSYGSLSLDNVARLGPTEEFVLGDLMVAGSLAGGGELDHFDLRYVPEPTAALLFASGLAIGLLRFRRVER
jgi:hypothetical protein